MTFHVTDLYRYPVKSLSPERLDKVALEAGGAFPYDRAFALKKDGWMFDRANPEYQFKTFYHVLLQNERLAALKSRFDPESGRLNLSAPGGGGVEGPLTDPEGRRKIAAWLTEYLGAGVEIVESPGFSFSDVPMKVASIINLASVRDLSEKVGADLDPLRFRGNIHIDGGAPWQEFGLVGKTFQIGSVTFETVKRIGRCAATNVNRETATRDQNLPKALVQHYGHYDMGIYAKVLKPGRLKTGDAIRPL